MAAGLATQAAARIGCPVIVRSASILGLDDYPADPNAVAVCTEIDIDLSGHRSQPLTDELIAWCDYILVMEYRHARQIGEAFPQIGERVLLLGSFAEAGEISDPLGGWKFRFRRTRDELSIAADSFINRLPKR